MKKVIAAVVLGMAVTTTVSANTYVVDGPANVRTGAGLENPVIGLMPCGSEVELLEWDVCGWAMVNTPYGTGYIFNQLLENTDRSAEMQTIANQYASETDKVIVVDTSCPTTYIYAGSDYNRSLAAVFSCAVGKPETPTPTGVFTIQNKRGMIDSVITWEYFMNDFAYDSDGVAWGFHSVLCNPGTYEVVDGRTGCQISNGCIRLSMEDAQWFYDNCGVGSTVVIL